MEKNQKYEKYIYILITVFVTWMIVGIAYSSKETELNETISSQNETITQLQEELKEKDGRIESLNTDIDRKDDEISDLNDQLNEDSSDENLEEVQIDLTDNTSSNEKEEMEYDYILNKNTKVFHYSYCSSVSKMKDKNKKEITATRDEMINKGYKPCGRCNP